MVNMVRGESVIEVGDQKYKMVLTMGILAEIQAEFKVQTIAELAEVFGNMQDVSKIIKLVAFLMEGGGVENADQVVKSLPADFGALTEAIYECIAPMLGKPEDLESAQEETAQGNVSPLNVA